MKTIPHNNSLSRSTIRTYVLPDTMGGGFVIIRENGTIIRCNQQGQYINHTTITSASNIKVFPLLSTQKDALLTIACALISETDMEPRAYSVEISSSIITCTEITQNTVGSGVSTPPPIEGVSLYQESRNKINRQDIIYICNNLIQWDRSYEEEPEAFGEEDEGLYPVMVRTSSTNCVKKTITTFHMTTKHSSRTTHTSPLDTQLVLVTGHQAGNVDINILSVPFIARGDEIIIQEKALPFQNESPVTAVHILTTKKQTLVVGCQNGAVHFFDITNLNKIIPINNFYMKTGISTINNLAELIICATEDGTVSLCNQEGIQLKQCKEKKPIQSVIVRYQHDANTNTDVPMPMGDTGANSLIPLDITSAMKNALKESLRAPIYHDAFFTFPENAQKKSDDIPPSNQNNPTNSGG